MAAGSLLALIDDIASILDDVAVLGKVAAKQTVGVLGDDLALNAQQVAGVDAARELPVVWAVAKGSLLNKAILIPAALAVSAFAPWAVTPLLIVGGAYLCFEGAEKLAHRRLPGAKHSDASHAAKHGAAAVVVGDDAAKAAGDNDGPVVANGAAFERDKISGAVRTDFVLSAEIIAITLGTVAGADFSTQLAVLVGIGLLMTVGVYGFVAGIVKLDDAGLYLSRQRGAVARAVGQALLRVAPWLMKLLSLAGTAAMFIVGGGIIVHGLPWLRDWVETAVPSWGSWLANAVVGVVAGAIVVAVVQLAQRLRGDATAAAS